MEQLTQIVISFENLMIAGGSLFALWGVYNLLEEKTKDVPATVPNGGRCSPAYSLPDAACPTSSPSFLTASFNNEYSGEVARLRRRLPYRG